ncbi:MAG: TetR family transcriptional regulator [Solirubrobacteraceae bacterium]
MQEASLTSATQFGAQRAVAKGESAGSSAPGRERILRALAEIVAERGFADTTLTGVLRRARVSRGTFVQQFESLNDALCALLDIGLAHSKQIVSDAFDREAEWQDGLLCAIALVLEFLDAEPTLARVWLVEALAAGRPALERWEQNVELLRVHIVDYLPAHVVSSAPTLASSGALNAILAVARQHVVAHHSESLTERLEDVVELIAISWPETGSTPSGGLSLELTLAWLSRRAAGNGSRREVLPVVWKAETCTSGPGHGVRASECLAYVEIHPGACNREIADALAIRHGSHVSRLLRGLFEQGLVRKEPGGAGRQTRWYRTSAT